MTEPRSIALLLVSPAILAGVPSLALAQDTDTIYDDAGVLTNSQEQKVQESFDSAREESGQPIYAFLVPDTGVEAPQARQALLTQEASEANVPQDAGVIMVAPEDRWDVAANLDGVSNTPYRTRGADSETRTSRQASSLVRGDRGEPTVQARR